MLYLFVVHFLCYTQVLCQTFLGDTFAVKELKLTESQLDSSAIDSSQNITLIDTVDIVFDDGDIDGPINYHADDSIVYDMKNQKLYLYGNAYMKYTDIELNSDQIEYDWVSGTLTSRGKIGPDGELESPAMFSEKSGEYEADSMQYNFKTKKGRTFDIVSEQDGAYIHSEVVQKNEFDEWYGFKTKYTTCTNKEHPHFYLGAKKSKVIPIMSDLGDFLNEKIISCQLIKE